jgi:putative oxidoreductase
MPHPPQRAKKSPGRDFLRNQTAHSLVTHGTPASDVNSTDLRSRIAALYSRFEHFANYLQSPLLLVLRVFIGWQFFGTGKGKLLHLGDTAEFFASLHIPFPTLNAALAGATECFGGLLLLVGLLSRLTAIPLIATMVVAYLTADLEAVQNIFADPDKFTGATPFLFLLVSLIVLAFGPGAWSVDHWLKRKPAATATT